MLLLILEYIFFVRMLSAREKLDEMKLDQEYMDVYAQKIQQEQDRMLKKEEELSIIRHDLRHYMKLAYAYITEGKIDKVRELLEQTDQRLEDTKPERFCENLSVNVVATYCMMLAQKKKVSLELDLQIPGKLRWNEYEYATVVSNLLENAIYAADMVADQEHRVVKAKAQQIKEQMVLEISNYYENEQKISRKTGLPISEKGTGHGFGMKSVKAFVEKNVLSRYFYF